MVCDCCHPRVLEYSILFGLQILWGSLGIVVFIIAAYSQLAGFLLLVIGPLILLLPAIFLPMVVRPFKRWLLRMRFEKSIFHRYDWNIIWSLLAIKSYCVIFIWILYSKSLFWSWTHPIINVNTNNATYEMLSKDAAFHFPPNWRVNISMMGEQKDVACDDEGCVNFYHCFAPVLPKGKVEPNLFWTLCPYQKENCTSSITNLAKHPCFNAWLGNTSHGGVITRDPDEFLIHATISEQAKKYNMGPDPPRFLILEWENIDDIYAKAFMFFWISLAVGHGIVALWIIFRRLILSCICGPYDRGGFRQINDDDPNTKDTPAKKRGRSRKKHSKIKKEANNNNDTDKIVEPNV